MKIVQVPFCYYPDAVGGTEIYVEALAKGLRDLNEEVVIAAPGAAYMARRLQPRTLMVTVGVLITLLSLRTIYLAVF